MIKKIKDQFKKFINENDQHLLLTLNIDKVIELDTYIDKLERENLGLKQTVSNYKEKEEKFYKY